MEITGLNINSEVLMRVKQEANIAGDRIEMEKG